MMDCEVQETPCLINPPVQPPLLPAYCTAGGYLRTTSAGGVAASGETKCRRGPSSRRRRRSCSGKKIRDKLRTLRQMLPQCSEVKTDKASTLGEVIKYVKSLQHQVQAMSASGYAIPTPIWPVGVMMPPPWIQLPDVLGGQAPLMLTGYPVFPTVHACDPRQGTPQPLSPPHTHRHPAVESARSGRGQQLAPRRPLRTFV